MYWVIYCYGDEEQLGRARAPGALMLACGAEPAECPGVKGQAEGQNHSAVIFLWSLSLYGRQRK
jgi:hypothetical protein